MFAFSFAPAADEDDSEPATSSGTGRATATILVSFSLSAVHACVCKSVRTLSTFTIGSMVDRIPAPNASVDAPRTSKRIRNFRALDPIIS
ncbi:hypothetical protein L596_018739 [Steinernema carpocapsae]|uniref:Uncharacterized protein n=1 Tax=Steinernema carpocapsae TaxID=34508 RepID=A0A4V6A294_STECR|nr:hypothetical protein L596_018739 [Steinernema carpocapsae]